ncbi:MAG TPA: ferrochelatase [Acidimicrobiales bacterium]|nr:ferrochelatase [Acidimicrobiales bacterium]
MGDGSAYDAVVVVSFGGPEGPDEVRPFLERVTAGRGVPAARLDAVAEHYHRFGGVSPINGHNRALVAALGPELAGHGIELPVYWGNRNWHPLLADTLAQMRDDGVRRALALVTSAFGSYSGCRQYLEDIERARAEIGAGAPVVDKLRLFYNHPGFVAAVADGLSATVRDAAAEGGAEPSVLFTAHSIPESMAASSPYEHQLRTAAGLVAEASGVDRWELVYQSRSGSPAQPWLGPDILERLRASEPGRAIVACPVGFVADHMEVVYDLDTEAAGLAAELGIAWRRAPTAGTHPRFVSMVRELIQERLDPTAPRAALGPDGPWPDHCPAGCCPPPPRPAGPAGDRTVGAAR